jgi:hypothetical protein
VGRIAEAEPLGDRIDRFPALRIEQGTPHRLEPAGAYIGLRAAFFLEKAVQAGARDAERCCRLLEI